MPVLIRGIFSGGGKIKDATALPSDVAKGKVFYNNDGRQVGTLVGKEVKTYTINMSNYPYVSGGTSPFDQYDQYNTGFGYYINTSTKKVKCSSGNHMTFPAPYNFAFKFEIITAIIIDGQRFDIALHSTRYNVIDFGGNPEVDYDGGHRIANVKGKMYIGTNYAEQQYKNHIVTFEYV